MSVRLKLPTQVTQKNTFLYSPSSSQSTKLRSQILPLRRNTQYKHAHVGMMYACQACDPPPRDNRDTRVARQIQEALNIIECRLRLRSTQNSPATPPADAEKASGIVNFVVVTARRALTPSKAQASNNRCQDHKHHPCQRRLPLCCRQPTSPSSSSSPSSLQQSREASARH